MTNTNGTKWLLVPGPGHLATLECRRGGHVTMDATIDRVDGGVRVTFSPVGALFRPGHAVAEAHRLAAMVWDTVADLADEDPVDASAEVGDDGVVVVAGPDAWVVGSHFGDAEGEPGERVREILTTPAPRAQHTNDRDCAGHIGDDDCCSVCGACHGWQCSTCGGRGFHEDGCAEVAS